MLEKTILQSKTIDFLRFPLIVGVVLIHSQLGELKVGDLIYSEGLFLPIYTYVSKLFSHILAAVAVPLFFIISGFLFFYKSEFSLPIYMIKLKKRINTLLIPYIFWNLVVILLFYLAQSIFPTLMSGGNKLVVDYTLMDCITAFWCLNDGMPICFQLWFLRDLLVLVLLTPIIFILIKRIRFSLIFILLVLWLFDFSINIPGLSIYSLLFFVIGASFSIMKYNLVKFVGSCFPYSLIGYCFIVLVELNLYDWAWINNLHKMGIILGCISFFYIVAYMINIKNGESDDCLKDSSFFIYAYHGMFLTFIMKVMMSLLHPTKDMVFLLVYFLSPLITITMGLLLYSLLKKYLPKFTSIITGGR